MSLKVVVSLEVVVLVVVSLEVVSFDVVRYSWMFLFERVVMVEDRMVKIRRFVGLQGRLGEKMISVVI